MAAETIGRTDCPECDFKGAHVRKGKALYRWCPECGALYHATKPAQAEALLKKTRITKPEDKAGAQAGDGGKPADEPKPAAKPAPARSGGLLDFLFQSEQQGAGNG